MNILPLLAVGVVLVSDLMRPSMGDKPGFRDFGVSSANVAYASVQVVSDRFIIVSQEPIFVQQDTDNTIYWSLPPGGAYFFSTNTQ